MGDSPDIDTAFFYMLEEVSNNKRRVTLDDKTVHENKGYSNGNRPITEVSS